MNTRAAQWSILHTALLAFLFFAVVAAAQPESLTIRATGFAEGQGIVARRAAAQEAGRDAIAQYVERVITREGFVDPKAILRHGESFIERITLLRYDENGEGTTVEADVRLREPAIHRAIAEAFKEAPRATPDQKLGRVAVIIGEQLPLDTAPAVLPGGIVESALIETLKKWGMEAGGCAIVEETHSHPELVEIVLGDVEAGRDFALALGYDVVITGTASVTSTPDGANAVMLRHEAALALRFYRGFDGKMIESVGETQAVHSADFEKGPEQALRDVAARASGAVCVAATMTYLSGGEFAGIRVELEQPGPRERVEAIAALLRTWSGVREVREVAYDAEHARLDVDYTGPVIEIADLLDFSTIAGARVRINRVVGREIHIDLRE